jgi:hypothetical protein
MLASCEVRHPDRRRCGAPVAVGVLVALGGCAQPTVDAVAVWIDDGVDAAGQRPIRIYDRGVHRSIELQPKIASASTDLLRLQVAPGAIGFVASAVDTMFIDLRDGGRGHMNPLAPPLEAELESGFAFTRSGLGIYREFADEERTAVAFMPTAPGYRDPFVLDLPQSSNPSLITRLCRGSQPQSCMRLRTASAAPVVFAVELGSSPTAVNGRIVAWGFPGDDRRGGSTWNELTLLGLGELVSRGVESADSRIDDAWCVDRLCISPEGEAAIGMAADPLTGLLLTCELVRWRWDAPREPNTPPVPERIELSPDCPDFEDPWIIAALAPDLVVLDDDDSIHLTDLSTGAWVSTPKLGSSQPTMFPVDGGRAMLFVASNGAVSRADDTGVRIVSAEHTNCAQADTVVSPDGGWVVQTCLDDTGLIAEFTPVSDFGSIVRISASGLERYDGIPMRPLAVDDAGNALFFSYDRDDNDREPRGLFVLDAGGTVNRVDDLEPTPKPLVGIDYISAEPAD